MAKREGRGQEFIDNFYNNNIFKIIQYDLLWSYRRGTALHHI